MTAYHATHPSPYDDACPDCAGLTEEPDIEAHPHYRLVALLALIAAVALVFAVRSYR